MGAFEAEVNERALGATFGGAIEQVLEILLADGEDVFFGEEKLPQR